MSSFIQTLPTKGFSKSKSRKKNTRTKSQIFINDNSQSFNTTMRTNNNINNNIALVIDEKQEIIQDFEANISQQFADTINLNNDKSLLMSPVFSQGEKSKQEEDFKQEKELELLTKSIDQGDLKEQENLRKQEEYSRFFTQLFDSGLKHKKPIVQSKLDFVQDVKKLRNAQISMKQTLKRLNEQREIEQLHYEIIREEEILKNDISGKIDKQQIYSHTNSLVKRGFELNKGENMLNQSQLGSLKNFQKRDTISEALSNSITKYDESKMQKRFTGSIVYEEGLPLSKLSQDYYENANKIPSIIPQNDHSPIQSSLHSHTPKSHSISKKFKTAKSMVNSQQKGITKNNIDIQEFIEIEGGEKQNQSNPLEIGNDSLDQGQTAYFQQESHLQNVKSNRIDQITEQANLYLHQKIQEINISSVVQQEFLQRNLNQIDQEITFQQQSQKNLRSKTHSPTNLQQNNQSKSNINIWSPNSINLDYADLIKLQRPLLGSKLKYNSALQKKLKTENIDNQAQEDSNLNNFREKSYHQKSRSGIVQFQITQNIHELKRAQSPSIIHVGSLQDVQSAISRIKTGQVFDKSLQKYSNMIKANNSQHQFGMKRISTTGGRFNRQRKSQLDTKVQNQIDDIQQNNDYGEINSKMYHHNRAKTALPNGRINKMQRSLSPLNKQNQKLKITDENQNERLSTIQVSDYRERMQQSIKDTVSLERKDGLPSKVQLQLQNRNPIVDGKLLIKATILQDPGQPQQSITLSKNLMSPSEFRLKQTQNLTLKIFHETDLIHQSLAPLEQDIKIEIQSQHSRQNLSKSQHKLSHSSPKNNQNGLQVTKQQSKRKQILNKAKNVVTQALSYQDDPISLIDQLNNSVISDRLNKTADQQQHQTKKLEITLPDLSQVDNGVYSNTNQQIIAQMNHNYSIDHKTVYVSKTQDLRESSKKQTSSIKKKSHVVREQLQVNNGDKKQLGSSFEETGSKLYKTQGERQTTFQENMEYLIKELTLSSGQQLMKSQNQVNDQNSHAFMSQRLRLKNNEHLSKEALSNKHDKDSTNKSPQKQFWIKEKESFNDYQQNHQLINNREFDRSHKKTELSHKFGLMNLDSQSRAKSSSLNHRKTQNHRQSNSVQVSSRRNNIEFRIIKLRINAKDNLPQNTLSLNQHQQDQSSLSNAKDQDSLQQQQNLRFQNVRNMKQVSSQRPPNSMVFELDLSQHFKFRDSQLIKAKIMQKKLHTISNFNNLNKLRVDSPGKSKSIAVGTESPIVEQMKVDNWKQIPQNNLKLQLTQNDLCSPNTIPLPEHNQNVKKFQINQYFGNRNPTNEVTQYNKGIMQIIGLSKQQIQNDVVSLSPKANSNTKSQIQKIKELQSKNGINKKIYIQKPIWNGSLNQSGDFKTPISMLSSTNQSNQQQSVINTRGGTAKPGHKTKLSHGVGGLSLTNYQQYYQIYDGGANSSKKLSSHQNYQHHNQDLAGLLRYNNNLEDQASQLGALTDHNNYLNQPRFDNNQNQALDGIRLSYSSHTRQRSSVLFKHSGSSGNNHIVNQTSNNLLSNTNIDFDQAIASPVNDVQPRLDIKSDEKLAI
eukprot:403361028